LSNVRASRWRNDGRCFVAGLAAGRGAAAGFAAEVTGAAAPVSAEEVAAGGASEVARLDFA
jgi:hypothetical protein